MRQTSFCRLGSFGNSPASGRARTYSRSRQLACSWRTASGRTLFKRHLRRAAVVIADPARELEDLGRDERLRADDLEDGLEAGVGRLLGQPGHAPEHLARAERDLDAAADVDLLRPAQAG